MVLYKSKFLSIQIVLTLIVVWFALEAIGSVPNNNRFDGCTLKDY